MVVNKLQNNLKIVAIKAPLINTTDYLKDLSVYSGSTLILDEMGTKLERCDPVYVLGKVKKVIISKDKSLFIGGEGKMDDINSRIEFIKSEIEHNILIGDFDKD